MDNLNYIIIFVLGYFIINQITIDQRVLFNLIIIIAILYYYYTQDKKLDKDNENKLRKNFRNIQHLKFIYKNTEILEIFYSIRSFRKYNTDIFNKSLKSLDNFYRLINDLKIGVMYEHYHIETASYERRKVLNLLSNLIISIPTEDTNLREKKLKKAIDKIESITENDLKTSVKSNNNKINNKTINVTKKIIYSDDPQPKDPFFEKNLEIY